MFMQGADDTALVVGSGVAPFGRLARAKLGCALAPYFGDGPIVPVRAQSPTSLASPDAFARMP